MKCDIAILYTPAQATVLIVLVNVVTLDQISLVVVALFDIKGDHFEASGTSDPSFFVLHGTLLRYYHYKQFFFKENNKLWKTVVVVSVYHDVPFCYCIIFQDILVQMRHLTAHMHTSS